MILLGGLLALAGCAVAPHAQLVQPGGTQPVADPVQVALNAHVVLLGERHDNAADHQWQMVMVERLHAADPELVLAFEMFPRMAQPVLNLWVAGRLSDAAFLQQAIRSRVWGFNPALYMPIFSFARDNRVPMVALNVSPYLVHLVAQHGWQDVAVADCEGVGTPVPADAAYRAMLMEALGEHGKAMTADRRAHFIDAQLLWDRALAEAIARQGARHVVALMGEGTCRACRGSWRRWALEGLWRCNGEKKALLFEKRSKNFCLLGRRSTAELRGNAEHIDGVLLSAQCRGYEIDSAAVAAVCCKNPTESHWAFEPAMKPT